MYIAMFPSFSSQTEQWDQMMKTIPEGMIKAFNLGDYSFARLENFLSAEIYMITWPLLLIVLAVSAAGSAIAGEIEKGTIEFLLSQSISRAKLYLSRYIAGVLAIFAFVAITIFIAIPLAKMFNISIQTDHYATLALIGFLFGLSVFSIGFALSAIFSDRGKVYFITSGLMILMYTTNVIASLEEKFSDLKYFSFFYYYSPTDALIRNKVDDIGYFVFSAITILAFFAGLYIFSKRDIAT